MATKFFDNNGIVSFDSISSEEDLKLRPGININPPPDDGKCDCCGRHISELKPFGKAEDSLVSDSEGALLIKSFRPMGPYDEEAEKARKDAEKHLADAGYKDKDPLEWMIKKYGKEKGTHYECSYQAYCQIGSSWECRDCIVLGTDEYYEKLCQRF